MQRIAIISKMSLTHKNVGIDTHVTGWPIKVKSINLLGRVVNDNNQVVNECVKCNNIRYG